MSVNASQDSSKQKSSTFVDPGQQPFLRQLRNRAFNFSDPRGQEATAGGLVQGLLPGLQQGFNQLGALGDPQGQIDAQTASLQSGLGQLFREEINPAITSDAIGAGGLGGGRQGVAQGVAAGQIGQAFTQGLGDITARANAQASQSLGQLPGFAQQLLGIGLSPGNAAFDQLSQLAAILGTPTILSKSKGKGSGQSAGFGTS